MLENHEGNHEEDVSGAPAHRQALNDAQVKAMRCPPGEPFVEVPVDSAFRGLRLRVTAADPPVKTWYFKYKLRGSGKQVRMKLGRYPETKLSDAKKRLTANRAILDRGEDPLALRRAERLSSLTVKGLMDLFYEDKKFRNNDPKTQEDYKHVFKTYLSDLDTVSVSETDKIRKLVREAVTRLGETHEVRANRTLKSAKRLFKWARETELITDAQLPLNDYPLQYEEKARDRVFEPEEMRAILNAQMSEPSPIIRAYWMLLWYTVARNANVRGMRWEALRPDPAGEPGQLAWFITKEEMKARRAEIIPLSTYAVAIIEELRPITGDKKFVLASMRADWPDSFMSGSGKPARRIKDVSGVEDFHAHAIRHTVATYMGDLDVSEQVVSRVLSHRPVGVPGVTGRYNHNNYLRQRRIALQAWGKYLTETILAPEEA